MSTIGQDLGAELTALTAAGVDTGRVFTDKLSGSVKTERPGLAGLLDYARPDDTTVVTAIDRLGRSVAKVTRTIADLGERGMLLRTIRKGVDTATRTGGAVAAIMATLAELELELGRDAGRPLGDPDGPASCPLPCHPSSMSNQAQLSRLADTGEPVHELAAAFGISRATAYRYLAAVPTD